MTTARTLPPDRNEYETPQAFYDRLHEEFDFDVDAFASEHNAKCAIHWSLQTDCSALTNPWRWDDCGGIEPRRMAVFANPPYASNMLGKCVTRMAEQSITQNALVVGLVPPSISTRWWHDIVMRYASEVRTVDGRLSFEYKGQPIKGNRGDSVVIVFRPGVHGPVLTSMRAKL